MIRRGIFGIGEMQYSEDCVDGKRSFVLPPVQMGVKSKYLIEVELHAVYNLSVWVKGKAESSVRFLTRIACGLRKNTRNLMNARRTGRRQMGSVKRKICEYRRRCCIY